MSRISSTTNFWRRCLADGQFPPSPRIQAAVEFVEQGGERAVVCRPGAVVEAPDNGTVPVDIEKLNIVRKAGRVTA